MVAVKICKADDVKEGKGRVFNVEGIKVAVHRRGDKYYAMQDECPHKGMSLSKGELEEDCVVCPGHGWKFSLSTGQNTSMPISLKMFKTSIVGQDLYVEL